MPGLHTLVRVAELPLTAARRAGSLALWIVRHVSAPILGQRDDQSAAQPAPPVPGPDAAPTAADTATASTAPPRPPRTRPAPPPPAPAHVDREAVLVAESADLDAADGVGAQIHIEEPWPGYRDLTARQVIAQLSEAGAETLAVVRLYEQVGRKRRTVLAEIDRRLAAISR